MRAMKFFLAIVAYLIIGIALGVGLVQTMKGNAWLLIAGLIVYIVAFGKIGCLPKKGH